MLYSVVMTTFENEEEALDVINAVIEKKLAACVQTFDIKSHYFWQNDVCHDNELLVLFKTQKKHFNEIKMLIEKMHSYETPEIIEVPISNGSEAYLEWIKKSTL